MASWDMDLSTPGAAYLSADVLNVWAVKVTEAIDHVNALWDPPQPPSGGFAPVAPGDGPLGTDSVIPGHGPIIAMQLRLEPVFRLVGLFPTLIATLGALLPPEVPPDGLNHFDYAAFTRRGPRTVANLAAAVDEAGNAASAGQVAIVRTVPPALKDAQPVVQYDGAAWVHAPGLAPDVLSNKADPPGRLTREFGIRIGGIIRYADYGGPWLLEELRLAANAMLDYAGE